MVRTSYNRSITFLHTTNTATEDASFRHPNTRLFVSTMRHLSLMRFLMVSSFAATSPDNQANALALQGKSGKLRAALSSSSDVATSPTTSRRAALAGVASLAFLSGSTAANALDMDAFVNSELDKDEKNCNPKVDPKCAKQMTSDEAMCKYGQSGEKRGEACKRYRESGGGLAKPGQAGTSPGGAYAM